MGLKEDSLFCRITPDNCSRPVADFLNYVLKLMNSKFFVDVEDPYPPPIRKPADAPAHHKPAPSTCSTNELDSSVPLDFPQRILSSTIILSPVALFADSASPPPFVANASPSPSTAYSSLTLKTHVPLGILIEYEGMSWSPVPVPASPKHPRVPARAHPPPPPPPSLPPPD